MSCRPRWWGEVRGFMAPSGCTFLFSMVLRMLGIAMPLYMAQSGLSLAVIGLVVAAAGVSHLVVRPLMARLLRICSDRTLVVVAVLTIVASALVVLAHPVLWVFTASQLLQGVARALFWTASQTYVVHGREKAARGLTVVSVSSSVSQLVGPVVAGALLGGGPRLALAVTALTGLCGLVPALRLDRHEPFPSRPRSRSTWRRAAPAVRAGAWGGISAGALEALMGSYIPLLLVHLDYSPLFIGVAVSAAGVGGIAGSLAVGPASVAQQRAALTLLPVVIGAGLLVMLVLGDFGVVTLGALFLIGAASGAQRILGPAIASDAVHQADKGDALVVTGTFRAASLVAAPALVSVVIPPLGLVWAIAVAAATIAVTSVPTARLVRLPRSA